MLEVAVITYYRDYYIICRIWNRKVNSMHYGMHCIEEVVKFFSVIVFAEFIASRQ